ncbi:MAG: hypothetical protein V9F04_14445 [Dermatophilaceae bacterium]
MASRPRPTPGTVVSETGPDVPAVETGLCARASDRLTIVATGRHTLGCSLGTRDAGIPGPMTGRIVRVDATSFDLDTCPPTADCVPLITTFKVTAPGLDLRGMREKSYVEVTYTESFFFGCSTSIVVRSVDTWTGVKNPADVGGKIYLAGGDGDDPTLPFAIDKVRQHCLPEGTPTCGGSAAPDHYAYRFAGTRHDRDGRDDHVHRGRPEVRGPQPARVLPRLVRRVLGLRVLAHERQALAASQLDTGSERR